MRDWVRKVHWLHALAAATIIVWSAPSRSSAAKSTAYDTDIVDPLEASGRLTFSADASDEQASRNANRIGLAMSRGRNTASTTAPAASTAPTNSRAWMGRSFTSLRLGEAERVEMIPRTPGGYASASRLLRPAGRASGSSWYSRILRYSVPRLIPSTRDASFLFQSVASSTRTMCVRSASASEGR